MATPNPERSPTKFSTLSDQDGQEGIKNLAKTLQSYDQAKEAQRKTQLEQLHPDRPKKRPVLLAHLRFGKRVPEDLIRKRNNGPGL